MDGEGEEVGLERVSTKGIEHWSVVLGGVEAQWAFRCSGN